MRFTTIAISAFCVSVGGVAAFSQTAFAPSRAFVSTSRSTAVVSKSVSTSAHTSSCSCSGCSGRFATRLFAEAEAETAEAESVEEETEAEVPSEVAAMDGIESAEEAHNAERPARQQLKKKKAPKGKPLSEFEAGSMVQGTVRSIQSYGAFVDIGAQTDGLLHISQLSAGYVADVNEVLKEGQELEVRIVNIDTDKNQVGLSLMSEEEAAAGAENAKNQRQNRGGRGGGRDGAVMSALSDKGWDEGAFVEGTVVSTVDFGCFVRVDTSLLNGECEGEMDGLVHISALGTSRVSSVTDVVNVDDKVQVRVKGINGRKVSLSMLSLEEEAAKAEAMGGSGPPTEGAKDWKESLEKMQAVMPAFNNAPLVEDRRK